MNAMAIGLALLLAAPGRAGSSAEPRDPERFGDDVQVGAPITRGNLTVYPLTPRTPAPSRGEHLLLDEAIAKKQLAITEVSASGTVNALRVENRGDAPVVLVAGELLLGGKQDRIVARSLVLGPRSSQQVTVFCVERGRWGEAGAFESGGALAHPELRKTALAGDQGKVWSEVARSNARLGTTTASDTYRAAARKIGADVSATAREIAAALAKERDAAGLAVAIDGEVIAVEWFASPDLFARIRGKLVESYVAQAQASGGGSPPAAAPAAAAVADFAAKAERGEAVVERVRDPKGGKAVQTTYLKK